MKNEFGREVGFLLDGWNEPSNPDAATAFGTIHLTLDHRIRAYNSQTLVYLTSVAFRLFSPTKNSAKQSGKRHAM